MSYTNKEFWKNIHISDNHPWGTAVSEVVVEKLSLIGSNKNILDIGCGTGRNSEYLNAQGHTVTGIDFCPEAINMATGLGSDVTYLVKDITSEAFTDTPVDCVIDFGCYHCLLPNERQDYSDKLADSLVSGGYYISVQGRLDPETDIVAAGYNHPKLSTTDFDIFNNSSFEVIGVTEHTTPPIGAYNRYACWVVVIRKN